VVTSTMVEAGLVLRQSDIGVKAIAVSALDPDLLNACLRLVRLLQMPEQYRVLGNIQWRFEPGCPIERRCLTGLVGQRRYGEKTRRSFTTPRDFDQLRRALQRPADVSTVSEKHPLPKTYETK
jgi:AraC-type transcriptional regulator